MTQQDRDKLVALQKLKEGLITQREAGAEIGRSERHVRRLLKRLKGKGHAGIVHGLRGRRSNRKIDEKVKQAAIKILSDTVYSGFGPTLAAEYLADKHDIRAGRETVRGWMTEGKLWRPKLQRIEKIYSGGSGGPGWANWCNGIPAPENTAKPANTPGWKTGGRSCI